ncbi:MAG: helix-turn-helix transcriptional regulator [Rhodospirillaceae bacterium]|jgi:DNA-binding HxlR family transcriptional regulator|nr:helix-turn-helix transcriptional regulator [Rhodospirillaceae bacterium]MBT3885659.1 helix-turn-helix transcriptional regulator [Rhodospirillaceae bacterium]MBT4117044.1 helix-turn-helix transcriptional regulator [Rhodospirillaceae bacterium]MBT4672269.1 helix-turn-helix transcriptional regulator [Rhodospirillaceae bacterium]MBT4718090.1 helix-turn-helix transcriptional regulator [Rhodospirillaceae bacterium]
MVVNFARSPCPIASTLDLVGDRWTLVVIRDMLNGKSRYNEFAASPEGIPTNILAERLKRLTESGLAEKHLYQEHPPRFEYRLTHKGAELLPVLQEICRWANVHIPDTWIPPTAFMRKRRKSN